MTEYVEYTHDVDAKHASNIGEESVSNPVQAVKELVKNAYDADAENVWVELVGHDAQDVSLKEITKITVKDDGYAMTDEDFKDRFFRIGNRSKAENRVSPIRGRRVVGEKGMGHYAAKRLGSVIKIISSPLEYEGREASQSMDKTITVTLDWREFKPGLDFTEIKSKGEIVERNLDQGHGLLLEISELTDTKWSVDDIRQLRIDLAMMIMPKELRDKGDDDNFTISITAPGLPDDEQGPISEDSTGLNMALFKLTATATYDKLKNITTVSYKIEKKIKATSSDTGYIWDRQEHNKRYQNSYVIEGGKDGSFGDAKLVIYWYPQGGNFGPEQKKIIGSKQLQEFLRKWRGIKLYQDGIGISGFGEYEHTMYDWAELDTRMLRAFKLGGMIRLDTVVGYVRLTRDGNTGIREVASRQAVMETDDYESLKVRFVREVFEELEDFRKEDNKLKKVVQHQIKAQVNLDQAKRNIRKFVKDPEMASQIINHLDVAGKEMKQADKQNKKENDELIGSLDMYRPLSTLGISTLAFDHEIGQKFSRIGTYLYALKEEENLSADALEAIKAADEEMKDIQAWREFLDLFATALGSMGSSRKAREEINLREMVDNLAKSLKPVLVVGDKAGNDIEIKVNAVTIGRGYKVVANRAALISVFTNLFVNSMKSLRFAQRAKPVINIKIWSENSQLLIEFNDNGNGVPDENIQKIWKPFFSSYPKHGAKRNLRGMGLGLTLTSEIVEEQYLGTIELSKTQYDKSKPGKGFATFLISIPKKELESKK